MNYPAWLGDLSKKAESLRSHHGLFPARDGWYKTINLKKRYIAKPMPLEQVVALLPAKEAQIRGEVVDRPAKLAVNSTTIKELMEMFLAHLWQRHLTGTPRKLAKRTYDDYMGVLARFVAAVGRNQLAIAVNPTWFTRFVRTHAKAAATSRRRDIIYITAFFNWAGPGRHSQNFYDKPVQFGPDFIKPDEGKLRTELARRSTHYSAETFQAALMAVAPSPLLWAVGLLGLNAALLPVDLAEIPLSAIDLDAGTHSFPRGKTSIPRKAVLMPETIAAIRRYLAFRPEPTSPDEPLFVRENGKPFGKRRNNGPDKKSGQNNAIATYWGLVTGQPLKGLRTTIGTELDGAVDQNAVNVLMGHAATSVRAKHYVKQFADDRLRSLIEPLWRRYVHPAPQPDVATISASGLARRVSQTDDSPSTPQSPDAGSETDAASPSAPSRRAPAVRRRESAPSRTADSGTTVPQPVPA